MKNFFNGKNILITGGTGSFGKKFIKFLLKKYKAKKIIIYSRDEFKQYEMQSQFTTDELKSLRFFLGDVRDKDRLLLATKKVDIIVHAAALKQVPAAEYNPMEFVKTNIHGAENIVFSAIHNKVKKVIALSTDKAANPINLYGSTKLASDKIFIAANNIVGNDDIAFSVVRYGNVVGSRGSVWQLYNSLTKKNNLNFPVTDPQMTRFWITLDQGVEFVDLCLKKMTGGEIFIPIIPSIKITDLAKSFGSKKTKIIGIRPGEKLHEVLCPRESWYLTFKFKKFFVIFSDEKIIKLKKIKKYSELGVKVKSNFEYNSFNNTHFLSVKEIKKINNCLDDTL